VGEETSERMEGRGSSAGHTVCWGGKNFGGAGCGVPAWAATGEGGWEGCENPGECTSVVFMREKSLTGSMGGGRWQQIRHGGGEEQACLEKRNGRNGTRSQRTIPRSKNKKGGTIRESSRHKTKALPGSKSKSTRNCEQL